MRFWFKKKQHTKSNEYKSKSENISGKNKDSAITDKRALRFFHPENHDISVESRGMLSKAESVAERIGFGKRLLMEDPSTEEIESLKLRRDAHYRDIAAAIESERRKAEKQIIAYIQMPWLTVFEQLSKEDGGKIRVYLPELRDYDVMEYGDTAQEAMQNLRQMLPQFFAEVVTGAVKIPVPPPYLDAIFAKADKFNEFLARALGPIDFVQLMNYEQ